MPPPSLERSALVSLNVPPFFRSQTFPPPLESGVPHALDPISMSGSTSPPFRSPSEALTWLAARGAHPWLVRHHELVLETAEVLPDRLQLRLGLRVDRGQVLLGAALHDAGKVVHPEEMRIPGHAHEHAGERLLREAGLDERVARIAVTHASWSDPRARLEDRLVALADKLWKGKRDENLESLVLDEIAARLGRDRWSVFDAFDTICDEIALDGPGRLRRSDV